MLTVKDLINIKRIPNESEISLQLIVEFYETYIMKRFYTYHLTNGTTIKLSFSDLGEIFHISGVDHVYVNDPLMTPPRFIDEIKKIDPVTSKSIGINFSNLAAVNPVVYSDYSVRIRSMCCLDTILMNSEYLSFNSGVIPNTENNIKVRYLLLTGIDGKNLHLGIDSPKKGATFFAKTLLITGKQSTKYIDRADEVLEIDSIVVSERGTKNIIETINRKQAKDKARELISNIVNDWIENSLRPKIHDLLNSGKKRPACDTKNKWKYELMQLIKANLSTILPIINGYDQYKADDYIAEITNEYKIKAREIIQNVLDDIRNEMA